MQEVGQLHSAGQLHCAGQCYSRSSSKECSAQYFAACSTACQPQVGSCESESQLVELIFNFNKLPITSHLLAIALQYVSFVSSILQLVFSGNFA